MSEQIGPKSGAAPKPTILVTGASGFIGRHIVQVLQSRGYPVRAMRHKTREDGASVTSNIHWVDGELDAPATLRAALKGCAGVIHCAGFYPRDGLDMQAARARGVRQIRHLFDACLAEQVARVVYISSPATLGVRSEEHTSELQSRPHL